MIFKSSVYLASVILATAGLLIAPSSQADDSSTPGTACSPSSESSTSPLTHLPTGGLVNNHTSSLGIVCPVQRDSPNTTTGAWVAVFITNPSGKTTTCNVYSNNVNGSVIDAESKSTSTSGFQAFHFTNINSSAAWGNYTVACSLPAGGTIHTYFFAEN
jgi:hypothetical protein